MSHSSAALSESQQTVRHAAEMAANNGGSAADPCGKGSDRNRRQRRCASRLTGSNHHRSDSLLQTILECTPCTASHLSHCLISSSSFTGSRGQAYTIA